MPYITVLQIVPELEKIKFENLTGNHFLWLLIFMFAVNLVYVGYRVYKAQMENKRFAAIYKFIEKQGELNARWDQYIKSLTERFIREAPPDQIRIFTRLLFSDGFKTILGRTERLIELNGISNRDITEARIKLYINNTFDDIRGSLDLFMYHGRTLSCYLCENWAKQVISQVTHCVYGTQDLDALAREFEDFAKQIKFEFYHRMSGKYQENE